MKLFFYGKLSLFVPVMALSVILFSGCGTVKEESRGNNPTQFSMTGNPGQSGTNPNNGMQMGPNTQDGSMPNLGQKLSYSGQVPDTGIPAQPESAGSSPNSSIPGLSGGEGNTESKSNALTSYGSGNATERKVAENVLLEKENIGGMTESELAARLTKLAEKLDVAPVDASFDPKTWAVREGKYGKRLDTAQIQKAAFSAVKGEKLRYSRIDVPPGYNISQRKEQVKQIAKFTTPFLDRSRSRLKNIRLVSAKLDGKIIPPGQEFSFNRSTGSKAKKFGYEDATIIVKTPAGPKHKKAPGGGVCQVSTTLYNAVLQCGLKVTERHEHSDEIYYVPDGKDATVTYGGPDFRFVNSRSNPVMLRIFVGKRSLQVRIYENSGLSGNKS